VTRHVALLVRPHFRRQRRWTGSTARCHCAPRTGIPAVVISFANAHTLS
jgi:hypothetical protein